VYTVIYIHVHNVYIVYIVCTQSYIYMKAVSVEAYIQGSVPDIAWHGIGVVNNVTCTRVHCVYTVIYIHESSVC